MSRSMVDDPLFWIKEFEVTGTVNNNQYKCLCPCHAETNPSCVIYLDTQRFKCFSCDATGDLIDFFVFHLKASSRNTILVRMGMKSNIKGGKESVINPASVAGWHEDLLRNAKYIAALRTKGINLDTIRKYMLGYHSERVTIPIQARDGTFTNVRLWSPTDRQKKVINLEGMGKAAIFPIDCLDYNTIFIAEGELKALLLTQMGFPCICSGGGANTWKAEFTPEFAGKKVYIVFDIDPTGRSAAQRLCRELIKFTPHIYDILLPISTKEYPKGDITNYFVDLNHTKEDFEQLLAKAIQWTPGETEEKDYKIHKTSLAKSSLSQYHGKRIQTTAVVSAKDVAPYFAAEEFLVYCDKNKDYCSFCPIYHQPDDTPVKISDTDPITLSLINTTAERRAQALKIAAKIPNQCATCRFKVIKSRNVEEVRLIPSISIGDTEESHTVVHGYTIGHGIETNITYLFEGRAVAMPSTQQATLLINSAVATSDSLSNFLLTDENYLLLKDNFQPSDNSESLDNLLAKFADIYSDLEANVTRIYQRTDLHIFYDLVYHSCLYIPFQNKNIKGWVEGLVIGDSGQGKTDAVERLMAHYGLGEKVDCKGVTTAGLLGGLADNNGRYFVSWGTITLNDRRLVVLEEVKGMSKEVLATMTEARSSGVVTLVKIEKAKSFARTRLLWLSNPRSDRQIGSYNFGVETIKELVGSLEDIRRFDFAMVVASGEVSTKDFVNILESDRPKKKHTHTNILCKTLILWAWSRKPENIIITKDAEKEILEQSNKFSEIYSSNIPLVEPSDMRLKFTRLATAAAARVFSTDNGTNLIVKKSHVQFVAEFLDRIYSSSVCGYKNYSLLVKGESQLHNVEEIKKLLLSQAFAKDMIRCLLEAQAVSAQNFTDWTSCSRETAQDIVSTLVRNGALKRVRSIYVKSSSFIIFLKELQKENLDAPEFTKNLENNKNTGF